MPGELGRTMVRTLARGSPAEIPRTVPNEPKVQLTPNFFFTNKFRCFPGHFCENIIAVAIIVNFLRIFKVRENVRLEIYRTHTRPAERDIVAISGQ